MTSHLNEGTLLQGGKYQIVRSLGQGGFGITYEAIQVALKRKVAIKEFFMRDFCLRETSTSAVSFSASEGGKELVERFRGKFIREAQMIAGFDHPNIVKIHDVFEENGTAYYVMEYLEGGSLDSFVKNNGPLPELQALDYIRQVGSALSYLHQHNSLHFDVKPENILINKAGRAILIDFGVSKHYDETGHQTSSTPVGLSRGYAPLEQYKPDEISSFTPATDIYSLGATLYRLISGIVPPDATEVYELGVPQIHWASPAVMSAICAAMQPRRKDRPQSVEALMSMLSGGVVPKGPVANAAPASPEAATPMDGEGTVIVNAPSAPDQKTEETSFVKTPLEEPKKKPWVLPVVLGLIAVGVAVASVFLLGGGSETTEPGPENASNKEIPAGAVDLGIIMTRADGTTYNLYWAKSNLCERGLCANPEDYGDYYAWGETAPKSEYRSTNYKFRTSDGEFSKYNTSSEFGTVDGKTVLDPKDDAARVKLGGKWRMPTDAEWAKLRSECAWKWTTKNGATGYKVTSPNGNSIFLPAAGYWHGTSLCNAGSYGYYWLSSLYMSPYYAWEGGLNSGNLDSYSCRFYGHSVRPVTE